MLIAKQIHDAVKSREIIIEPYRSINVQPNSYDISLGEYVARWVDNSVQQRQRMYIQNINNSLISHVEEHKKDIDISVMHNWELPIGYGHDFYPDSSDLLIDLSNIEVSELFQIEKCESGKIRINSGERILCHTKEFFGSDMYVPCLATRSSIARLGLDICGSAGFGDLGYINRWTLELENNSPYDYLLPVGTRVGQVYFHENHEDISNQMYQVYDGQYSLGTRRFSHREMIAKWQPEMMIPRRF